MSLYYEIWLDLDFSIWYRHYMYFDPEFKISRQLDIFLTINYFDRQSRPSIL